MAQTDVKLNDSDRKLTLTVMEKELHAVKDVTPDPVHKIAVQRYRKDLAKVLNKLDKRYRHYA
jgi:hypothetical protein